MSIDRWLSAATAVAGLGCAAAAVNGWIAVAQVAAGMIVVLTLIRICLERRP